MAYTTAAPPLHPVFRHLGVLGVAISSLIALYFSVRVNAHSASWLIGFIAVSVLLVAAVRRRQQSPLHRAYAFYLAVLGVYLFSIWCIHILVPGDNEEAAKHWALLSLRLLGVGGVLMPVVLFDFTLLFSGVHNRILRVLSWAGWIAAAYFLMLVWLGLFFHDVRWEGHTWVPVFSPIYVFFFIFTSIFVFLGVGVPIVVVCYTPPSTHRLQLIYYLLGGLPLWLSCWGNFLISLGVNIYPAGGLLFMLHAGILAYAVFKRKLFDLTVVIRRGLAYAGVSVVLGALYAAAVFVAARFTDVHASLIASIFFAASAALIVAPLIAYLQSKIDLLFFRKTLDRQLAVDRFSVQVASTVNLNVVTAALCQILQQTFLPRKIDVFLNTSENVPVLYASYGSTLQLAEWPHGKTLAESNLEQQQRNTRSIVVTEGFASLSLPIVSNNTHLGVVVLEPRLADEPYTELDVQFASTIVNQSAVALANSKAFTALESLQELTTQTLDGLSAGVLLVDPRERILRRNRAAADILYPASTGAFPNTLGALAARYPQLVDVVRHALAEAVPVANLEFTVTEKKPRNLLINIRLLTEVSREVLALVHMNDITEYKEIEKLARKRENLAQMGELISSINHELNNILQPIQTQVTRLSKMTLDDPILQGAMAVIPDRLQAMNRLLLSMKDLARPIELRIRPLELKELIQSALNDVISLPGAAAVQVRLELDTAGRVRADGHWLRLVLYNLMRNAVEAPATAIGVAVVHAEGLVIISVRDNGPGIDAGVLARLFEPFFSTKGAAGTGLGLSISRKVIELHGGRLECTSAPGEGAEFRVILPE